VPVCPSSMGRFHPSEGNPKAREEAEVGDREGEESTTTVCRDGEAVVRGNGKAV
jgi:hypothetical protein